MSELTDFELTNLVFVFGTLKSGYRNNKLCLNGAEFLGEAISVDDNYVMQDVGFPTLWQDAEDPQKGRVVGEVYQINSKQLVACDRLEHNGRMYTRETRPFRLPDTTLNESLQNVTAWVYLWNLDRNNEPIEPVDGLLIWDPEGRWKMRRVE